MMRKSVLPVVGCALLLFCSCSKSEPPGNDSSTSGGEAEPSAESSAGETQKDRSAQEESSKTADTQAPEASNRPGIKVGEKAPAFKLKDQHGNEQSLEYLVKQGSVALVFYRSADW